MTPAAMSLLADLRSAGMELAPQPDGRLNVKPRELLTPERRQAILTHKTALLAALALEQRIREMGTRWGYDADDLAQALAGACENPAGWLAAAEQDEQMHELSLQAGRNGVSGRKWP
jgi:hypothetical protein